VLSVFVLGWLFKRGVVDPLFKFGMMPIVVATIGLSIAMRNAVRAGYSAEPHPFPNLFPDEVYNIAGVTISATDIGTFVFAIALVLTHKLSWPRPSPVVPCKRWRKTPRVRRCWASTCPA
jgi:branched-chain amino acid transport system permease protein